MAQLVLWLRVCHKAMVVAKLDSGKIFFQVHSVAIVRPPFLSGCWLKASLISLPLGLSIGQLTTWQHLSSISFASPAPGLFICYTRFFTEFLRCLPHQSCTAEVGKAAWKVPGH